MPETIVRTFSLLAETDRKLEELTRLTFRRNKGDVIDWIVAEAYEKAKAQAETEPTYRPVDE